MGKKLVEQCLDACDELVATTAELVGPHDKAELEAFALKLCGLEGLDYDDLVARLHGVTIPGDFRHVRVTNLNDGREWFASFSVDQRPLELEQILLDMACSLDHEEATASGRGVWTETVALPVLDPGVLELGVRFLPLH
ncbi:hypothetical protein [Sphingomonas corticis]|uniref:Uncharacterized protein n=1 Tax=Sphingomonas corticis TaxID=2722791 RepID=A0ABX1CQ26_9SPHN|nr:hypothetical protein [Sphingomonas corticis]NJR80053.1 hypothetical protein [Sphingomonas corticis]